MGLIRLIGLIGEEEEETEDKKTVNSKLSNSKYQDDYSAKLNELFAHAL